MITRRAGLRLCSTARSRPDTGSRELLKRARMRADGDDPDGARRDALEVLQVESLSPPLVRDAVLLAGVDQSAVIAESKAIASLRTEDLDRLINELAGSLDEINVAISIVDSAHSRARSGRSSASPATDGLPSGRAFEALPANIAGLYVGLGSFRQAVKVLRREGREFSDMDLESAFNYGMAMWGERSSRSRSRGLSRSNRGIRSETRGRITCSAWPSHAGRQAIFPERPTSRTGRGEPYAGATARRSVAGGTAGCR